MGTIVDKIDELYDHHTHAEVEAWMIQARDQLLNDPSGTADLIAVCNELAALYREQSRYEESAYNFELALQKTEELTGSRENRDCAVLMLNVAGTYRYAGLFEKAHSYYLTALGIIEKLGLQDTYEYASLLNNLSNVLQDMHRFDEAMVYATKSYEFICKTCAGQTEEAISLMNLASIALHAGDLDTASDYAKRAIKIYDDLHNTSGHYPAAINLAAVCDFKRGDYDSALAGFEHSAQLTRDHFGENRDYASALVNIATVLDAQGKADEAEELRQKAERIRANLK